MDLYILAAAIGGIILPVLISMNIFSTKADTERLRGDIASAYVLKAELDKKLDHIETLIYRLIDSMEKK